MRTSRRPDSSADASTGRGGLVTRIAVLALLAGALAAAPAGAAGPGADAAVVGDVVAGTSIASATGYERLVAGPDVGAPALTLDPQAGTVTIAVDDSGRGSTWTMAWPARVGSWPVTLDGAEPEQRVRVQRGASSCSMTAGTLVISEAVQAADGSVATLVADVRQGSCWIHGSPGSLGLSVRVGTAHALPAAGRAAPSSLDTGAVQGTPVSQRVLVRNVGGSPWRVRTAGTGSAYAWSPSFRVEPGSDTCTGVTLPVAGECAVTVSTTAPSHGVSEHLVVAGDGAADLVVPLRLEGFAPVPPPTSATAVAGRLRTTLSWQPAARAPRVGYRVYDLAAGRTLVAQAGPGQTAVAVAGRGPRHLAVVAADGVHAESPAAEVRTPAVTREIVAWDPYAGTTVFAEPTSGSPGVGRDLAVQGRLRLDPARTSWVASTPTGMQVCAVDREACAPVPGTGGPDHAREPVWLPDGRLAYLSQADRTELWVVGRDGSGLRRVGRLPDASGLSYGGLAAAPDGTEVLVHGGPASAVHRVRLSDGRTTEVPGTRGIDDFSVTTAGRLVLQRRLDLTRQDGPTRITTAALDGTGVHHLALPAGDNRGVVHDPSGRQLTYVRHTSTGGGTVWVAAADGSGAREVSDRVGRWRDLHWSDEDAATPSATLTSPTTSGTSTTVLVGARDADDPAGSLRRECRLDAGTAWVPCSASWPLSRLARGTHTAYARVTDPAGRVSAVVSRSWVVDADPPVTTTAALVAVQTALRPTLSWTATDTGGAGVASHDARVRSAPPSGAFGGWARPAGWQGRTSRTLTLSLRPGHSYCLAARSTDRAGNTGAWSPERCTSVLLDDRALAASRGWTRGRSSAYAYGTWSRAASSGAVLTRTGVQTRRVGVRVTTCPTCGTVEVRHAGVTLGRVDLSSSTTARGQLRWLPRQVTTRTGTLTVRSVDRRPVHVDGIAVQH